MKNKNMARILVVDDDPDILKMADKVLSAAGFTVFTAEDARRGMDWLEHIDFDLLLSDAVMPYYSGFEFVATLRANARFKHLNIAMLTGLTERKDVERAVQAGVDDYIVKPIDPMILIEKVNALFARKPPVHYPEINVPIGPLAQGAMRTDIALDTVSELGANFYCPLPVSVGLTIDLQAAFFEEIGMKPPPVKVIAVELDETRGQYLCQTIFLGVSAADTQKIRRWLYSHGATARGA